MNQISVSDFQNMLLDGTLPKSKTYVIEYAGKKPSSSKSVKHNKWGLPKQVFWSREACTSYQTGFMGVDELSASEIENLSCGAIVFGKQGALNVAGSSQPLHYKENSEEGADGLLNGTIELTTASADSVYSSDIQREFGYPPKEDSQEIAAKAASTAIDNGNITLRVALDTIPLEVGKYAGKHMVTWRYLPAGCITAVYEK